MFKQILAGLALVLVSLSASAQSETCTYHYGGGKTCWGPGTTGPLNQGRATVISAPVTTGYPAGAVFVQQGTAAPQGYCSWGDRLVNVGVSAVVGGVLGALAKDTSRGAGQGAAVGGLVGVFIPCQPAQQGVVTQRVIPAQQQQGVVTVYGAQNTTRHSCMVGAHIIDVAPHQDCRNLTAAINSVMQGNGQQPQQAAAPQPQQAAQSQGQPGPTNAAFWGWHHPHASASNPMKCFSTKQISGKPSRCTAVEVQPANDGETELQWRARVATVG